MSQNILFIAIDVDDKSFHGCGINNQTGEIREFACKPTIGHLEKKLDGFKESDTQLKICYEATYLGFSLCRSLEKKGYFCEVIAPSLIPEKAGKLVKTDRLDSRKMAEYYAKGLLTEVHVPTIEEEIMRDMIRSRKFLGRQMSRLKLHLLSICRRSGINYRDGEGNENKHYWTKEHRQWLKKAIKGQGDDNFIFNMTKLLDQLSQFEDTMKLYDDKILELSQQESNKKKVGALCSYRGIDVLTAMTLITELGDIKRFSHPRQLCSYAGMELREYSSGGHEHKYRMSKMGNVHIRTSVIESCQLAGKIPQVGKSLKARRKEVDYKHVEIADRCMHRLYKKSMRLLSKGKLVNKVKVACARELLCFVWESLQATTAAYERC